MRKTTLILFSIIVLVIVSAAGNWKELKTLKSYVKTSNTNKGRELVQKCLKDSLISREPQLYDYAIEIEQKVNDAENMKLYLKQAYDTASFFNSVTNIFDYAKRQYYTQKATDPKAAEKTLKKKAAMLRSYYPNLYGGGVYFIKKKNWEAADRSLSLYIEASMTGIFDSNNQTNRARVMRAAFWSMTASFESKRYSDVFRYREMAEADTANLDYTLQYQALAYQQLGDTLNYVRTLKRGLSLPDRPDYYFSRLTDFLNDIHHYQSAYQLNDSLLQIAPDNPLYIYAQTVSLFNMKDYDRCIQNTQHLLEIEPTSIEAQYYMGICWYNKGLAYESTLSPNPTSQEYKQRRAEVNQMLTYAMPYLERFREARPAETDKWQTPLYKIYFNLNLTDKLHELEK